MGGLIVDRVPDAGSLQSPPAVWAGPECSFLTVNGWECDQLALTGHDGRLDDIDRLASLGATAVRYPVLWGRDRGRGAATDWRWAATRIRRLDRLGVRPIVALLHHGFGPAGADPLHPDWPAAFGAFALAAAERLPEAAAFLPINEPLTTARFGALYGWWAPYARDAETFASLVLAECLGYLEAARAIRAVRPDVDLIVNEDIGRTLGTATMSAVVDAHNARRWLGFDLLTGRVDRDHPLWRALAGTRDRRRALDLLRNEPVAPDLLGVDHYITSDRFLDDRITRYPEWTQARDDGHVYANVELARVDGHEVDGFRRALADTWDRYAIPVALTEVQLAGDPDDQIHWWSEAWTAARAARRDGIPVAAVTAWSVFGAYEWASVLRRPCGSYEAGCFDVSGAGRGAAPRRTPLADAVAQTAAGARLADPRGWWRRPDRVLYRPDLDDADQAERDVDRRTQVAA